ncbi:branched-chain amino acid ABC transporter permease [Rhodococcus sp. ACPA4]|uniref:branched-chain amino acid ABC transporter permease n=1 Tax=Rhodococcus sp. ACPA4 TaxID=2028571 RepID=UPI0015CB7171|nr:branched-chain amino acid ABC transporter permease [Rhodococcus sp. ACPA4]
MDLFLQQLANSLVLGGAYVMVALGLFLVFNTLHLPNFAHGEMFTLGAYLQWTAVSQLGISFWLALPLVAVIVAGVGWLLERSVFRRLQGSSVLAVLVGSLALSIIIQEFVTFIWGIDPLSVQAPIEGTVSLGSVSIASYRMLIIVAALTISALVGVLVYRSRFGRSLRAVAQNREIATLAGVNIIRVGAITFALGAGIAGLAGGLLAPTLNLEPHMGFHPTLVSFVLLVAIGAGGRLQAVVWGGFLIAAVETLAAGYISNDIRNMVVFVALVIFLSVRPEGAFRQASAQKVQL